MKTKIAIAAVLILSVLAVYILYNTIESYEEETETAWSKAALSNPYLAAEQFLQMRDNVIESSSKLTVLDNLDKYDVIIINDTRLIFSQKRVDDIMRWINAGGRLIAAAEITSDKEKDLLLNKFSIKKKFAKGGEEGSATKFFRKKISEMLREANEEKQRQDGGVKDKIDVQEKVIIPEAEIARLKFQNLEGDVRIHFIEDAELDHPALNNSTRSSYEGIAPLYSASNETGVQFLQFESGDGLFSLVADAEIWHSKNINELDHAWLLSILAGSGNRVAVLYGTRMPSIMTLIDRHAPELYFSCLVWLFLWIVYRARRFGPIRDINISTRRSLEEHILACGEIMWSARKHALLIDELRASVNRLIRRSSIGFEGMDKNAKISWLANKCNMTSAEIDKAMFETTSHNEETFSQSVSLLQKTGKKL